MKIVVIRRFKDRDNIIVPRIENVSGESLFKNQHGYLINIDTSDIAIVVPKCDQCKLLSTPSDEMAYATYCEKPILH